MNLVFHPYKTFQNQHILPVWFISSKVVIRKNSLHC